MGPLAGQLLLESVAAPFVLASLVMAVARGLCPHGLGGGWIATLAPALAIASGVVTTYLLAFGWPPSPALSARTKIVLSAIIGLAVGLVVDGRFDRTGSAWWARFGFIASAVGIPIWIGFPVLQRGSPESAFLALPIVAALALPSLITRGAPSSGTQGSLMLLTMAVGLAAIAAFAQALSFAELGLAIGSTLVATLAFGRAPLAAPAAIMTAAMLLALITALLLYSKVSLPALLILCCVIGADRLTRLSIDDPGAKTPISRILLFCLLPVAAAILIARIDAGPISIY